MPDAKGFVASNVSGRYRYSSPARCVVKVVLCGYSNLMRRVFSQKNRWRPLYVFPISLGIAFVIPLIHVYGGTCAHVKFRTNATVAGYLAVTIASLGPKLLDRATRVSPSRFLVNARPLRVGSALPDGPPTACQQLRTDTPCNTVLQYHITWLEHTCELLWTHIAAAFSAIVRR